MMTENKVNVVKNKSTTYMLPFVDAQVNFKFKHQILNSYLSFDKGDDIFCILYDWSADPDFLKFEKEMMDHGLYIGHHDYGDKCLYKFRLTRNMGIGKDHFIKGDHSKFAENHKDAIVKYLFGIGAKNALRIVQILNPDDPLTSVPPDMENEVFMNNVKVITLTRDYFSEDN